MIVNKCFINGLFLKNLITVYKIPKARITFRETIGNRDWVGFGINGGPNYVDSLAFPFPSIRFRENTNELLALREKEKGDWRKLTLEEKKTLYRASFHQTLEEVEAPTGEWKTVLGVSFFSIGVALWMYFALKVFILQEEKPTFSEEHRRKTLRKMLDLKFEHLTGISSKWDYEKDDWKK